MSQVRVRFAPSPTGFFHIGSARTALFNWLYARHTGGVFILRIEDTDKERNTEAFLSVIYDSLKWLGLNWDEGPEAGGGFGPYRQSERAEIYREYLEKLKSGGHTYEKDGAVYFRISGKPQIIDDAIRGRVERTEEKDFVIVRSDGNPVFHLVNVVDDITMRITHVIRGEDHLSNTSKHTELFTAFGVPLPVYAHIPLILKSPEMGKGKMSKRDKGALIEQYQHLCFLPEALVNYLALLGWNPGGDREKMPIDEIIRLFDLPAINQSNARFDEKKLAHMNMAYLLELPADRFVTLARGYFAQRANFLERKADELAAVEPARSVIPRSNAQFFRSAISDPTYFRDVMLIVQPKIKSLHEIVPADDGLEIHGIATIPSYIVYFFCEKDDYPEVSGLRAKIMARGDPKARLRELLELLPAADFSRDAAIEEAIKAAAVRNGLGFGDYQAVARFAVSGTNVGPGIAAVFRVLGRERVLRRLARMLEQD